MALKNGVLIFAAHADDTEFLAGGTVARLAAEGHEIVEVIATDNSRGTFELTAEQMIDDLTALRHVLFQALSYLVQFVQKMSLGWGIVCCIGMSIASLLDDCPEMVGVGGYGGQKLIQLASHFGGCLTRRGRLSRFGEF